MHVCNVIQIVRFTPAALPSEVLWDSLAHSAAWEPVQMKLGRTQLTPSHNSRQLYDDEV